MKTNTYCQNLKDFAVDFVQDLLIPVAYYTMATILRLALLAMGLVLLYLGITTFSEEVLKSSESLPLIERILIHGLTFIIGVPVGVLLVIKMLTSKNEDLTEL